MHGRSTEVLVFPMGVTTNLGSWAKKSLLRVTIYHENLCIWCTFAALLSGYEKSSANCKPYIVRTEYIMAATLVHFSSILWKRKINCNKQKMTKGWIGQKRSKWSISCLKMALNIEFIYQLHFLRNLVKIVHSFLPKIL